MTGLRERNKVEMRRRLLEAAEREIVASGFECTSLAAIARAAGVSHQTLYNYFPSKAHLLAGLLEGEMQAVQERMDAILERPMRSLRRRLHDVIDLMVARTDAHDLRLWREVVGAYMRNPDQFDIDFVALSARGHELFRAIFDTAAARGLLRDDAPLDVLAHTVFSLIDYGGIVLLLPIESRATALRRIRAQIDLVIDPWLARS